ncbi:hypothetical protein L2K20_00265 [Mycobacterium sp. MBM]|nr:hypothetical protein [Mycobacterium sp. MBM]
MSRQYAPYASTRDSYPGGYQSAGLTDPEADQPTGYRSDRERRRAARRGAGYGRVPRRTYADYDSYDSYDSSDRYDPAYADEADTDYTDYQFPADYHEPLDRRWIWVAGVAGVILMIAVICTGIILGGGDSGTVTAGATTSADPEPTTPPSASATPSAAAPAPPAPSLPLETVTTVTPSATATPVPAPAPAPTAPEPVVVPEAPVADPALAARTVTYHVTGNRQLIDLITVIYTDQRGALQTDVNVALPWVKTVTLDPGVTLSSVTATSVGGQLNCSIVDGSGAAVAVQANDSMIATCTR